MSEPRIPRWAKAVAATSPPMRHAAVPDLPAAVVALVDAGIPRDRIDWWYTTGHACAGMVIDDLQCDRSHAEWATAAVMYTRLVCGETLDDTDQIIEEAKLAVAWDAGTRGAATARPLGGS